MSDGKSFTRMKKDSMQSALSWRRISCGKPTKRPGTSPFRSDCPITITSFGCSRPLQVRPHRPIGLQRRCQKNDTSAPIICLIDKEDAKKPPFLLFYKEKRGLIATLILFLIASGGIKMVVVPIALYKYIHFVLFHNSFLFCS